MKKLLSFLVMFSVLMFSVGLVAGAPQLQSLAFTADDGTEIVSLTKVSENGFALKLDGQETTSYDIQFDGTTSTEELANDMFALNLVDSSVSDNELINYYETTKTDPWKTYLIGAVDGTNPFAYIEGNGSVNPKLLDAAQEDLGPTGAGMTIPGDYPLGRYVVSGSIENEGGESTQVTFVLYLVDEDQDLNAIVAENVDFTLLTPNLDFGTLFPGETSELIDNEISVNANNNVDFNLDITLSEDTEDQLFSNIWFDLDETEGAESQLNPSLSVLVNDELGDGTRTDKFPAELRVPTGFSPGSATGTIVYTFTAQPPV